MDGLHRIRLIVLCGVLSPCLLACPDGGDAEDAGLVVDECASFCELEESCGFRDVTACRAESCVDLERKPNSTDACIAVQDECGEIALCPCAEACARIETCTGSSDPACVSTCEALTEQNPEAKYRENRCLIESACDDIALCSAQ